MYVRPALRRKGIAEAVMTRLIAETRKAGLPILKLEAGVHSHAAIRFYERSGFKHCEAFEPYASMPAHTIVTSVFMEMPVSGG
jgi:putative acetyltransferase